MRASFVFFVVKKGFGLTNTGCVNPVHHEGREGT